MEMSTSFDLESILKTYDVSKESLKRSTIEDHRNKIAQKVGGDWESLATFIGVPPEDVDDIKVKYREPLVRRLAMMRRWYELWGKEATYLRLVEGLRLIGRTDLIEFVLVDILNCQQPDKYSRALINLGQFRSKKVPKLECSLFLILFTTSVVFAMLNVTFLSHKPVPKVSDYYNITSTEKNQVTNTTSHPQRVAFDHGIRNCSFPESDLPMIHPLFVGRENDVYQVLCKVARAHIVNINGAPGFGKSTLAIHVGYEIVKNGTSVRYINVEDKLSSTVNQMQKSEETASSNTESDVHLERKSSRSLIEFSRSSLSVSIRGKSLRSKNENLFEQLQRWSETVKCTSVLILDNCDDILVGTFRHEFLTLINSLVLKSHFLLHIITVSRERLLYVNSFESWTVRELNQSASVQLLDKLAPAMDNESLTSVAELVEGCPLALKVIGQLLHVYGAPLINKLEKKLITVLDKASVQEQRFRVIMDVAFNRLGDLKDCGNVLSLFPGSFDERAGDAIVQEECLETYLKHSLLNDYSLAFNYRYKMHRLIKEYLQEKISLSANTNFAARFKKHFETMLLTYAIKQEIDDTEKYVLSLELHNFNYLRELLLTDTHLSAEELAVLVFLFDIKFIQLEELHRYYALYIKNIREVCLLLTPKLCGQMYKKIVKHMYQQCRCETFTAYIHNFYISPCMKHFKCEVVSVLQDLYTSGVLQLSNNESSYIDLVVALHCNRGYYNNVFISMSFMLMFSSALDRATYTRMSWVVIVFMLICELALRIYKFDIKIVPHLRILEIISKCLCEYIIIVIPVILVHMTIMRLLMRNSSIATGLFVVAYSIIACYTFIYKKVSVQQYCCQFIPLCV